ncbi:MAG: metal-dependent transcriptional regulator [Clostridia bacterium]|nr:metal-dependent transcriptional regulator [Oscillospiraceae bacterium]MBQ2749399.1 metal-dependent transcriptional regulator [Clostridia bacterium]MBQ4624161.1 metal-dependent transcriptional regulator [Clostridia bacterium]MBQ6991025.1 metal-dependent transcriptional regulator [Clostridia bacterium]MBR6763373.1 metal-dependent transcriptional regulator [Clostridia bacterium]
MQLQESGEMYLESIYVLCKQHGSVRSVDVAEYMGFSKPSVSRAIGILKNGGYLTVDKKGSLLLTEEGLAVAENIYRRHTVLTTFLTTLGVDPMVASADACKLEHVISEETFEALCRYASERGLDT